MAKKLAKPVWAMDVARTKDGKPVTKRFTQVGWNLLAGDDNLKAGRWKRIKGPDPVDPVNLKGKDSKPPKVNATRTAIDLADEKGVNIESVPGSGDGGRILKADVEQYLIDSNTHDEEE